MKQETNKEWTAHCRDCTWSGRRSQDQSKAQQDVDKHLKTHPRHKVRLLVTGEDSAAATETEQARVEKHLGSLRKPQKPD